MQPIIKHAQSVSDLLRVMNEISKAWCPNEKASQEIWFRGQSRSRYGLLPGLYRPSVVPLNYDESNLYQRFISRGSPFIDFQIKTDWDWYFLGQHHGLPTRLLDWTDSLLAAAYFALSSHIGTGDRRDYDSARINPLAAPVYDQDSPAVWIIDATSVNQNAAGMSEDYVYCPGGTLTQQYLPDEINDNISPANRFPLAILPPHTNKRIAAQQGVFTIHGHDMRSIDDLARDAGSPIKVGQVIIDRANLAHFWSDLELAGVIRLSLFPDLDSVAEYVKWVSQNS